MTIIWYIVPEIWSAPDRIFLSSWAMFCPFTSLTAWKIKMKKKKKKKKKNQKKKKKKKKWKKYLEISSFYKSVPNIMICYTVPEIWHVMDVIVIFHLTIFCPFTPPPCPYGPKKSKFQKSEKKSWRNHHFTHVYQKLLDDVQFLTYGVQQTDRQTDRKSDIHRWVPHLKNF